ncbi:MAG TPA: hypothetical protein VJK52_02805 [Candidatus Nanoarchaeia archaeon]|nr:hypothetical protein [Candidatus Nanoarchaeia archaeon]
MPFFIRLIVEPIHPLSSANPQGGNATATFPYDAEDTAKNAALGEILAKLEGRRKG